MAGRIFHALKNDQKIKATWEHSKHKKYLKNRTSPGIHVNKKTPTYVVQYSSKMNLKHSKGACQRQTRQVDSTYHFRITKKNAQRFQRVTGREWITLRTFGQETLSEGMPTEQTNREDTYEGKRLCLKAVYCLPCFTEEVILWFSGFVVVNQSTYQLGFVFEDLKF